MARWLASSAMQESRHSGSSIKSVIGVTRFCSTISQRDGNGLCTNVMAIDHPQNESNKLMLIFPLGGDQRSFTALITSARFDLAGRWLGSRLRRVHS